MNKIYSRVNSIKGFTLSRALSNAIPKDLLYKGNGTIGIVREEFSMWERRSPLCPHHANDLVKQGFKVIVQPCTKRIFSDKEYQEAGAIIQEDLSEACLIVGVKKIPPEVIIFFIIIRFY